MEKPKWNIDFWNNQTKIEFDAAYKELVEKGFDAERARRFLEEIYDHVSEEYGQ